MLLLLVEKKKKKKKMKQEKKTSIFIDTSNTSRETLYNYFKTEEERGDGWRGKVGKFSLVVKIF